MVLGEPGSQHLSFRKTHSDGGMLPRSLDVGPDARAVVRPQLSLPVLKREALVFRILKERGILPLPSLVKPM